MTPPQCVCDPTYTDDCSATEMCTPWKSVFLALYILLFIYNIWVIYTKLNLSIKWEKIKEGENPINIARLNIAHFMVFMTAIASLIIIVRFSMLLSTSEFPPIVYSLLYSLHVFFAFTAYSALIFWWAQIYHNATQMVAKLVGGLKKGFIVLDLCFLVLFILVSIMETYTTGKTASYLRIVYGVISVCVSVAFIIYGHKLIGTLSGFSDSRNQAKIRTIYIWTTACSASLILLAVFQLVTRFVTNESTQFFIGRHSVYYTVIIINLFFVIFSLGGFPKFQRLRSSGGSTISTKVSQQSLHSSTEEMKEKNSTSVESAI